MEAGTCGRDALQPLFHPEAETEAETETETEMVFEGALAFSHQLNAVVLMILNCGCS